MLMFVLSAGMFMNLFGDTGMPLQGCEVSLIAMALFAPRLDPGCEVHFFSLSVKPKLISYWQPTANINNGWSCGWMLETPKVLDRTCLRRYRGPLCLHLKIPSSLWRVLFVRLLREDKRFWSLSNRQLFSVKGYLVVNQKRFKKFNL